MATPTLPQPTPWTVIVETDQTIHQIQARDENAAIRTAWFQATSHAGHDYAVTIHIEGPGISFPALTVPAALLTRWPDPEPEPWELEPEPVEYEEDELVAALAGWH